VCVLSVNAQSFKKIDVAHGSKEQDLEVLVCAVHLKKSSNLTLLRLYIALSKYLSISEGISAECLHNYKSEFLTCGNINTLPQGTQLKETNGLIVKTYNMRHTVNFVKKKHLTYSN
jgi:hypothetical protein